MLHQGAIAILCLASLLYTFEASHPNHLSHVSPGVMAAGLRVSAPRTNLTRRSMASQAARMIGAQLGVYDFKVFINGRVVNGMVDTGSGLNHVACKGASVAPGISIIDPSQAPALKLVPSSSSTCALIRPLVYSIIDPPALKGACEYEYKYMDKSFVHGRIYNGSLTFPTPVTLTTPTLGNFILGCSYESSPQFYESDNALFGMDWSRTSMWSQMVAGGIVGNSLYLCLGNGYGSSSNQIDWSANDESGVIIFGYDDSVAVTGGSVGGDVITITMPNPRSPSLSKLLSPPSAWLKINGLSIGLMSTSIPLTAAKGGYYLIDTGTSQTYLLKPDFQALVTAFCPSVKRMYQSATCSYSNSDSVFYISISSNLTERQLDQAFPKITFNISQASAPVSINPSAYMIMVEYDRTQRIPVYKYSVHISSTDETTGTLGNAWMVGWLIQQTPDNLQLKMTRVKSCADISYTGSTAAPPPKTSSPQPRAPPPRSSPSPPPLPRTIPSPPFTNRIPGPVPRPQPKQSPWPRPSTPLLKKTPPARPRPPPPHPPPPKRKPPPPYYDSPPPSESPPLYYDYPPPPRKRIGV